MKRLAGPGYPGLLAALILVLAGCQTPTPAPAPSPLSPSPAATDTPASPAGSTSAPTATVAPAPPQAFSGTEAHLQVRQLADAIGSRPTGTQKEKDAADYLADQYARLGYKSQQLPFEFDDYEERDASLNITAPAAHTVDVNPLQFSPGGSVSGTLVPAGLARPEDLPPRLSGNIALIERGTITFADKVANAARAGAAGAVIYNNEPGEFRGNLGNIAGIPAVGITGTDGQRLLEQTTQGAVQAAIKVDASNRKVHSQNILAKAGDNCRIIIGGHYDSVLAGPGANDNGSGTAAAVEAARVLHDQAGIQGLCFMAFGGEELGLWGSRRYVESLSTEDRTRIQAVINLDMVGVGSEWRVTGTDDLQNLLINGAREQGIEVQPFGGDARQTGGSDHASFLRAGIPAVFLHRLNDPNYHTAQDKAEFVDPAAMEQAGKIVVALVNRLAATG